MSEYVRREGVDISPDALRQASFIRSKKLLALRREKGRLDCRRVAGGFTEMVGAEGAVTINWKGAAGKLVEAHLPMVDTYNAPAPPSLADELCANVPEFRTACIPGSMRPEECEAFDSLARFRSQFEEGLRRCTSWPSAARSSAKGKARGSAAPFPRPRKISRTPLS